MQTSTLKTIVRQLERVISQDQSRPNLTAVEITNVGGSVFKIIACDGHILSSVLIEEAALDGLKKTIISLDSLPYLKSVLKSYKFGIPNCSVTSDTLTVDGKIVSTQDIRYPNTAQLIPKYTETVKFGIDAQLLLDLVKGLSDSSKTQCQVEIELKTLKNARGEVTGYTLNNIGPMLIKACGSENKDSFGIIMPVRI